MKGDSDFGGSPTLFSAVLPGTTTPTALDGACNKNGIYYALRQDDLAAGPVWSLRVGLPTNSETDNAECIAPAAWDGSRLYVAGPNTTIQGVGAPGSIRAVNPATGAVRWGAALPAPVDGAPALDGAGVLAVPSYGFSPEPNAVTLVQASNGRVLGTVAEGNSPEFAQPLFAGDDLLLGTNSAGLFDYRAPGS